MKVTTFLDKVELNISYLCYSVIRVNTLKKRCGFEFKIYKSPPLSHKPKFLGNWMDFLMHKKSPPLVLSTLQEDRFFF